MALLKGVQMNIERLHAIATAIIADINNTKTASTLQQLVESLQNQVNQPQSPQFQKQVSQHLDALYVSLANAPSNNFSPAWKQALKELGVHDLLGANLSNHVREIFERNQITPSVALQRLQSLSKQLVTCKTSLEQVISSFQQLNIGAEKLEPGKCELGILVPRKAINNNLNEFADDIIKLNKIFSTFSELTTGTRPGFEIRSISSSDLNVFLAMPLATAAAVAVAVERVVSLYKQILEVRKLHGELKNQGVPRKSLKGVENHANIIMVKGIDKLVTELLKKYYKNKDEGRRNELDTELHYSLKAIATRIDKGYSVEVRVQPISEKQQASEKNDKVPKDTEHINTILGVSKNLEFLRLEGDPILTLPESQDVVKKPRPKPKSTP
ncbi:MAG: hypothetical protein HW384_1321 [Dehalococcoidia bacterium]|nr:hypothetical protein [Dehalococcoidia bacterium]